MFKKILVANRGDSADAARRRRTDAHGGGGVRQVLGLAAVIAAILVGVPRAEACGTRPRPLSRDFIRDNSSAIVNGTLTYHYTVDPDDDSKSEDGMFVGEVVAATIEKGGFDARYPVRHVFWTFYCVGWGWQPGSSATPQPYTGRFFLRGTRDGGYIILRYEP